MTKLIFFREIVVAKAMINNNSRSSNSTSTECARAEKQEKKEKKRVSKEKASTKQKGAKYLLPLTVRARLSAAPAPHCIQRRARKPPCRVDQRTALQRQMQRPVASVIRADRRPRRPADRPLQPSFKGCNGRPYCERAMCCWADL